MVLSTSSIKSNRQNSLLCHNTNVQTCQVIMFPISTVADSILYYCLTIVNSNVQSTVLLYTVIDTAIQANSCKIHGTAPQFVTVVQNISYCCKPYMAYTAL